MGGGEVVHLRNWYLNPSRLEAAVGFQWAPGGGGNGGVQREQGTFGVREQTGDRSRKREYALERKHRAEECSQEVARLRLLGHQTASSAFISLSGSAHHLCFYSAVWVC